MHIETARPPVIDTILSQLSDTYQITKQREGIHVTDCIYCLTPDTKILRADLTWYPIGDAKVGDKLVGIDEDRERPRARRKMKPSYIIDVKKRPAECLAIQTSNGALLKATPDHLWLVARPGQRQYEWMQTDELYQGCRLYHLTEPWEKDTSWESGYLAGACDGEGCASKGVVAFSQKPNEMLRLFKHYLDEHGFHHYSQMNYNDVTVVRLGGVDCAMKFLGTVRPPRLLQKDIWDRKEPRQMAYREKVMVETVFSLGWREVVTLETSSHTFNAEGFWTHNCLRKAFWNKTDPLPATLKESLYYLTGLGLQDALFSASSPQPLLVDGIYMSPDYYKNGVLLELKTTMMGQKRLDAYDFPEGWLKQMMCYCYGYNLNQAVLMVIMLMRREYPLSYVFTFTDEELAENWEKVKETARELSYHLNAMDTVPTSMGSDWECRDCRYRLRCELMKGGQ